MTLALTALQVLALLAVLIGVALTLPLWGALIVDGLIVLVASILAELVVTRTLSASSDRISRPRREEVE